ncbi:hypothetical protein N9A94_05640 [Akkermansiaceae bacterium]|nr:hypothetical protein [Akkermansiaceae bacterium]MDB4537446.1 hypothetical protein [Akkermansiaceae bacterium]
MAVDEWLIHLGKELPILRFYEWSGDWVSLGYFQSLAAARATFGEKPGYVRRWTGGGVVDHRNDATYTLIIPRSEPLASVGGGKSYHGIHAALGSCLEASGHLSELVTQDAATDSVACFQKPVAWDLLSRGEKIAGAGQRRTRMGMLHQGSVAVEKAAIENLGHFLAGELIEWAPEPKADLNPRYASPEWTDRVL